MPPKKKQKTIGRILFSDSGHSVSLHSDGSEKAAEEIREILANVIPLKEYPLNPSLKVIRDNDNTHFTPIRTVTFGGKRKTRRKKRRRKRRRKTKRKKRRRKRKTKKRRR